MNLDLRKMQQKYNEYYDKYKNDKELFLSGFSKKLAERFGDIEKLTLDALHTRDLIGAKIGLGFMCRFDPKNSEYKHALSILEDVDSQTKKSARLFKALEKMGLDSSSEYYQSLRKQLS